MARNAVTTASGRRKRATLRDVARLAGVSPMTVSNVVNNRLEFVGPETHARVLRAIKDLDYRLLSSGRNLRLGKRQAIGVIIVDESRDFLSHPFISRLVSGLCSALNAHGYAMIVQGTLPEDLSNVLALHRAEADGYCVRLHGSRQQRAQFLEALGQIPEPVVLIQESLSLASDLRCIVKQDDLQGARFLARHLMRHPLRRVTIVVPRFSGPMTEARLLGLQVEFDQADPPIEIETLVCDPASFAGAYSVTRNMIRSGQRPDAIIGINDEIALAALRALQDHGIAVPEETMVAGFNGFFPPEFSVPSLTTIISRPYELGGLAARELLHHLDGSRFSQSEIVLPVVLRDGDSTDRKGA